MKRSSESTEFTRRDCLKAGLAAALGAASAPSLEAAETKLSAPSSKKEANILILGGGSGGIDAAARLSRSVPKARITLIAPNGEHLYQSGLFFRAAGLYDEKKIWRPTRSLLHSGVRLIADRVEQIDPEKNSVTTASHGDFAYDVLVVAVGVEARFDLIDGLEDRKKWEENGVVSLYPYDLAQKRAEGADMVGRWFSKMEGGGVGRILVAEGEGPIKAENVPLDILFRALEKAGPKSAVTLAKSTRRLIGNDDFDKALTAILKRDARLTVQRGYTLRQVDLENRLVMCEAEDEMKEISFDLLHVTPPFRAPACVAESPLAVVEGEWEGYLDLDERTLQHKRYANVFGLGDIVARAPKSGGATRDHAVVIQDNVASWLEGAPMTAKYAGYTVAPVKTSDDKEMFAEYDRHGLSATFPLDPTVPRKIYHWIDLHAMPWVYFEMIMRGLM